jgi:hypothetical protein
MKTGIASVCLTAVVIGVAGGALSACRDGLNSSDLSTAPAATGTGGPTGPTGSQPPPGPPASGGQSLTLSWDAPTQNTDGSPLLNLTGYKIYYGEKSGHYASVIEVANPGLTTYVVQNLAHGTYYFALTDYNSAGFESAFTPEVSIALD